ncbi:hypothetical protein HDU85_000332 [Gaertneriomyces sp. JEL0708]|nr:hypothetical protein HDU85_000332 [Gaertneriomyces sp. JEL0708]
MLQNVVNSLKLTSLNELILDYFRQLYMDGMSSSIPVKVLIGVCIFIAVRTARSPVLLGAIADAVECDKLQVVQWAHKVKGRVGAQTLLTIPEDHVDKLCALLSPRQPETACKDGNAALALIKFAKTRWLEQGRAAATLTAAAVCMAFEARRRRPAPSSVYTTLAESVDILVSTLRARHQELAHALLEHARSSPVFQDLKSKDFFKALPQILAILAVSSAPVATTIPSVNTDPPAFRLAQHNREELQLRLRKAQARVSAFHLGEVDDAGEATLSYSDDDEVNGDEDASGERDCAALVLQYIQRRDRIDKRIEQLLLDGVRPQNILDRNFGYLPHQRPKHDKIPTKSKRSSYSCV